MSGAQRSESDDYTLPDLPPPQADSSRGEPAQGDSEGDDPPVATTGSEATSTVRHGSARETGESKEQRGDTLDGSEGSASGGRTGT